MKFNRRRFIFNTATGLIVPFAGRIVRANPYLPLLTKGVDSGAANGMLTNLYAAFELDEVSAASNATDSTGGTAMTAVSSPTVDTAKIGTSSRGFNGSTNSRRFTRTESGLNGIAALTVSAWLKTTSAATTQRAVAQDQTGGTRGWLLGLSNTGKPVFSVANASASMVTHTGGTTVNTTNWYLVIGVYDGSTVAVYIAREDAGSFPDSPDGSAQAQTGNTSSPSSQMTIGCHYTTATSFTNGWTGSIDGVRIWRRALSTTDMEFEFNAGSGRAYSSYN